MDKPSDIDWGGRRTTCDTQCLPSFFTSLEDKLQSPLLQRAITVLKEDPSAYVSVEEWADEVGVSREHLTRSIAPVINPHALLQTARVCVALSELSGQQVLHAGKALEAMGYNSRAHAFAVFRKTTGLTPTEFWGLIHGNGVHGTCVLDRCPLVGAILDRYRRNHSRSEETADSGEN